MIKKLGLFVLCLFLTATYLLVPTSASAADLSGTYYIINPNSGKVLDVAGAGTASGTNVDIYSNLSGANQRWIVTSNGDGTYKIIDSNSNNSLDVTGAGTVDGTNVETWAYSGSANQRWKLIQNSDSTYKIIDSNSNKALDIYGGGTADGTNVDIWPDSGTANQKWVLISAGTYTWNSVPINGGGFVSGLIYNSAQNGLLFARTDVGGVFRWNASTTTWTPLMDFMGKSDSNDQGILSLAADPTNAARVYAMTGLYSQSWAPNGNFYYSVDQGNTWTKTTLPFKVGGNEFGRNTGERLQVDPNLPSTLFMGSNANGLWKSTNYGAQNSWSQVSSFPQSSITFVLMDPTSSTSGTATQRIIVGTTNTASPLYISNDGGSTWSAISGQPTGYVPQRASINSGNLYVTLSGFSSESPGPGGATSGAVYKYSISGNSWTNISPTSGGFGFGGIAVDKSNSNNIVVATLDNWGPHDDIYRSTDGGQTWTSVLLTYGSINTSKAPYVADHTPHWITDIEIDPYNNNNAFFNTGYGVFYTTNLQAAVSSTSKVAWSFEDTGLEETVPSEIVSPPSGTNLLSAIGDQSGFKHDSLLASASSTAFLPNTSANESIDFAESVPTKVVRTYSKFTTAGAAYSTDGGVTWTEFPTAPAGSGPRGKIAISADGSRILWTPRDTSANANLMGTYLSTNNGSSWTAVTGLPTGLKPVADRVNSNKFYAYDAANGIAYYSTNGGASFTASSTSFPTLPSWSLQEGSIKAVFGQEGHLWLTDSNNGLYRSTDSGVTYSKVTSVTEAYKIGFGKAISSTAYPSIYIVGIVGGTYGFYRSNDAGNSWTRINDSTHQFGYINDITGDPKLYGRVYIGTSGRGILYGN
jgi:hypothetical protein